MRKSLVFPLVSLTLSSLSLLSCGKEGSPVGSPCTAPSDCSGPKPACLSEFKPVEVYEGTPEEVAASFESVGLEFPGGYCSSEGSCSSDADCGTGGTCFVPMAGVTQATLDLLAPTVPFDLYEFGTLGICLKSCTTNAQCRAGYVCEWPIADMLTLVPGATKKTFCIAKNPCSGSPCQNGGTCSAVGESFACTCPAGYSGPTCAVAPTSCTPNPCGNGGTCSLSSGAVVCTCAAGYSGSRCETNVNDCSPNPCQNGGTCADGVNDHTCTCPSGFGGKNCEKAIVSCTPNPCLNGGTCSDATGTAVCTCVNGYSGETCEMKCGKSQLIKYSLTGSFRLTSTGGGDGTWPLPGTDARPGGTPLVTTPAANLVLRLHQDGVHVSLVSFDMPHNLKQTAMGMDIYTNLLHSIPTDACGAARGTLSGTTLQWDTCNKPSSHGTANWKPEELVTGPGCATNWGDVGNIWCGGSGAALCGLGGLNQGDNPVTRPPVWNEAFSNFVFADATLKSFTAGWFDIPNSKAGRSEMALTAATEISRTSEVTPDCACP